MTYALEWRPTRWLQNRGCAFADVLPCKLIFTARRIQANNLSGKTKQVKIFEHKGPGVHRMKKSQIRTIQTHRRCTLSETLTFALELTDCL